MPWFSLGSKFSFHNSLIHEWQRHHQRHHHWSHSGSRLRVFLRARPREDRHLRKANHVLGGRNFWNIAQWVKVILQLHFSVHERFLPWGWSPWGNALLVLGPDQSASEGLLLDPVHWEPPQTAVFRVDYWWVSRNMYYCRQEMVVLLLLRASNVCTVASKALTHIYNCDNKQWFLCCLLPKHPWAWQQWELEDQQNNHHSN